MGFTACFLRSKIIEKREIFARQLSEIIGEIHSKLSGGREQIVIQYEPDVSIEDFEQKMKDSQEEISVPKLLR